MGKRKLSIEDFLHHQTYASTKEQRDLLLLGAAPGSLMAVDWDSFINVRWQYFTWKSCRFMSNGVRTLHVYIFQSKHKCLLSCLLWRIFYYIILISTIKYQLIVTWWSPMITFSRNLSLVVAVGPHFYRLRTCLWHEHITVGFTEMQASQSFRVLEPGSQESLVAGMSESLHWLHVFSGQCVQGPFAKERCSALDTSLGWTRVMWKA